MAKPETVFLFADHTDLNYQVARDLLRREPVFGASMEEHEEVAFGALGGSLLSVLYNPQVSATTRIDNLRFAFPALVAVEVSLARLIRSWGVQPVCLVGCGVGEIAAAVAGGVLSVRDGVEIAHRAAALVSGEGRPPSAEKEASFLHGGVEVRPAATEVLSASLSALLPSAIIPCASDLFGRVKTLETVVAEQEAKGSHTYIDLGPHGGLATLVGGYLGVGSPSASYAALKTGVSAGLQLQILREVLVDPQRLVEGSEAGHLSAASTARF